MQVYPRSFIRIDGVFLRDSPANLLASGTFKHVPILAGYNSDEGNFVAMDIFSDYQGDVAPVMSRSKYEEELSKALYGNVDDLVLKSVDQEYVNWAHADNASADYLAVFTGAVGDQRFSCPTDHVIRTHTQSGDPVFQYFMTHSPTT